MRYLASEIELLETGLRAARDAPAVEIEPLETGQSAARDAPAVEIELLETGLRAARDAPAVEIEENFLVWKLKKRKKNKQAFIL